MDIKILIKKYLLPKKLLVVLRPIYHGVLAMTAHFYYGRPSRKLIVIGVTGTNGKSTTVNLIAKILQQAGHKTGYTSTVTLNIAGIERLNPLKMTMPSGWLLHKWLAAMVKAGCQYAILEVSSEGLAQNRHLGINFDIAVFTNLTPEHLESHGGFENYKRAKGRLFKTIQASSLAIHKLKINPQLQKAIIVNADDPHASYYAGFAAQKHVSFGVKNHQADFVATDVTYFPDGVSFNLKFLIFNLKLKGQFDVYNALAAIATAGTQGIDLAVAKQALEQVPVVPGRVEAVSHQPFITIVDYAYEPEEMRQLYETVGRWPHQRVFQVLGPTGGGRDKARIAVLGDMAAKFCDMVWVTTDDPYDDDPQVLAEPMLNAAVLAGKTKDRNLFFVLDRRQAIVEALRQARPGDIVLITGKGADQTMALANGRYEPWDDRLVVREALQAQAVDLKIRK